MMGTTIPRSSVNGCSIFWNLKRDLSGAGLGFAMISGSGVDGVCIENSGKAREKVTEHHTLTTTVR
jgi:hypothetical protein